MIKNPINLLVALIFVATIAHSAHAARNTRTTVTAPSESVVDLNAGLGLSFVNSTGFGVVVGGSVKILPDEDLYVGLDSGLNINSFGSSTSSLSGFTSVWMPLLVSAVYKFEVDSELTPYIGASLGPVIGLSNANTEFAFLFRPGAELPLSELASLAFEGKFGALGGTFFMVPHVAAVFHL